MKLKYQNQLWLSVGIVLLCNILTTICKHWIFHSIGFVLCGLMWIAHPVFPENMKATPKRILALRGAGVLLVLLGIFVRAYY